MILYSAADLLWATRIKATADAAGIQARPVRSLQMLNDRLADSPVTALVVDLDDHQLALELLAALRAPNAPAAASRVRTLAFGPHVATDLFAAARAAGADAVLPRGAFSNRLPEILAELDVPAAGPPPRPLDAHPPTA